jgi:hydroxyethylthiazole kinase
MDNINFSAVRGNISEIKAVYDNSSTTKGVDADESDLISQDNIDGAIDIASKLSKRTGAVVVITGAIDIVTNANFTYIIENGDSMMSKITGTGCMLTALIGSYCGANYDNILDATACAVASMSVAGELAHKRLETSNHYGTSSYRTFIIDAISELNIETLNKELQIEVR